ncbi:helix-turn-helix transcriptional regulator [Paenibacillus cymbidii]|uniref:helix-turn-helix transcriptional regulator n=1 Tax=Paenibacillus cymbidii TaxID=1639034 RepID=UPI00143674DD|nr:AraC family transcriptional regulator [Paenibacillus cymbidii]
MRYFSLARHAALDVKWAGHHDRTNGKPGEVHSNPHYELIVVADGPVHLAVGDDKLTLLSGDTLLLLPWDPHYIWKPSDGGLFFWAQFTADPGLTERENGTILSDERRIVHAPESLLRTSGTRDVDSLLLPRRHRTTERFRLLGEFERLLREFRQPRGYFRFRLSIVLAGMLEQLADEVLRQNAETEVPVPFLTFRRIVNHLEESYMQPNSKETIEQAIGRNYEYICQVFKKYAGISVVTYIHQLRIQRAKFLLHAGPCSLQEVAEAVGFQDTFYFSRVFKKLEGLAPSAYREANKSQHKGENPR